jgi:protocatechuate 3,4-dioxygenase beta subunit
MNKHDHHQGLQNDLLALQDSALKRRDVMRWAFGAGLVSLVRCVGNPADASDAGSGGASGANAGSAAAGSGGASACTTIPEETEGPYPADNSNSAGGGGPGRPGSTADASASTTNINALALAGIVRSDIRASLLPGSATATGVPLKVRLTIVDASDGCTPLAGYAVYVWHCDQSGNYSLYAQSLASENYLRGVQETDDSGQVTFTTIYPACYSGRWPHIHFEIYPSLDSATDAKNKLATSQLAMPEDICDIVFAQSGYAASITNMAKISLGSDNVFGDDLAITQTPTVTGNVDDGYVASLTVGIDPG